MSSTLLGILTALVIASAGYVAYKNNAVYRGKIEENETVKAVLAKSEIRLKKAAEELSSLPSQVSETQAENERLVANESSMVKSNEELKSKVAATNEKVASGKSKLDSLRQQTEKTGDLKDLSAKMQLTSAELEELNQSLVAAESKLANLTAQSTATDVRITEAKSNFEKYTTGQSLPALKTRIRNIYPNWGFVTLASGNNAGVIANSTLDVVRDDQVIAKLLVTAVENTTSSANIVPDSMSPDITLNVGDRVVPGQKIEVTKPAVAN
jgi:myosin heavy subunit